MMLRIAGDTLALTPPLIINEDQIGEIRWWRNLHDKEKRLTRPPFIP
jgi:adenosylmethionine-8-amino-7-oxononanoate aminotransferase